MNFQTTWKWSDGSSASFSFWSSSKEFAKFHDTEVLLQNTFLKEDNDKIPIEMDFTQVCYGSQSFKLPFWDTDMIKCASI